MAGIGPCPFAAMMLADMGADIIRIDRPEAAASEREARFEVLNRGRPSVLVDLRKPEAVGTVLELVSRADVLIEGFRPGVMERLGLGPDSCASRNPRIVYGRMTGWGQSGPLAHSAGHDINYIALSGILHAIGRPEEAPVPPLNLIGDFGGGAMYLLFGVLAALWERERSGKGQVVDAAVLDGSVSLFGFIAAFVQAGTWSPERGSNLLDGGAPWYDSYGTADGEYVCIGPIEPKFYAELIRRLGLKERDLPHQYDRDGWPLLRQTFTEVFRTQTLAHWRERLEGSDACFAPVLRVTEAIEHQHNRARGNFVEVDGVMQPAPTPRFSRTEPSKPRSGGRPGIATRETLLAWGIADTEVEKLVASGAAIQTAPA